jgi:hypothetical protein
VGKLEVTRQLLSLDSEKGFVAPEVAKTRLVTVTADPPTFCSVNSVFVLEPLLIWPKLMLVVEATRWGVGVGVKEGVGDAPALLVGVGVVPMLPVITGGVADGVEPPEHTIVPPIGIQNGLMVGDGWPLAGVYTGKETWPPEGVGWNVV